MEDNEERIFIASLSKDDVADFHGVWGSDCPTRQEAIEVMAKANWIAVVCAKNQIVPVNVSKEEWDTEWNKLSKSFKKVYLAGAEGSLNALLGVEK